jgi:tRNA threonylcarbamoyladenosine biosynthesis protein TsaB
MRVLALDTTTRAGSVALVDQNVIVEERPGDLSRAHAQRLPAEVLAVLDTHGVRLSAIDVFAVAAGPGSFTGLRIGLATIQGLAFVTGRPIVGISALEALAQVASRDLAAGALVAAWMDAQRREVFSALYRVTSAGLFDPGRLVELESAGVGDPERTLERWQDRLDPSTAVESGHPTALEAGRPVVFAGDGAVLYNGLVCGRGGGSRRIMAPPLLAGAVGRMAVARARRGEAVDPGQVHPLYVRRPDAEIDRERRTVDRHGRERH